MIGTFDYQERIATCAQWAETAANDQAKGLWKDMEQFWRQRAVISRVRSCASESDAVSVDDAVSADTVASGGATEEPEESPSQMTPPDTSMS